MKAETTSRSSLGGAISMFRPRYPRNLVLLLEKQGYRAWRFLGAFWTTQDYDAAVPQGAVLSAQGEQLTRIVSIGIVLQLLVGALIIILGATDKVVAGVPFGAAVVIIYPVLWAHLLALLVGVTKAIPYAEDPKKIGRAVVCRILERQVQRLRRRHRFTVVAVAGSIGKTSTKLAIADLLAQTKRVRWQQGNYNDRVTVPLVLFGHTQPNILNVFAWLKIFWQNSRTIRRPFPYDVVVVELGPDGPGQMNYFAYLKPDLAVLTAVAPEHMEFFKTLDAVAAEELKVFDFSKKVLVNVDDTPEEYLSGREFLAYGLKSKAADFQAGTKANSLHGQHLEITLPKGHLEADVAYIGEQGAKFALAAAAVADWLGVKPADIAEGLQHLRHFSGRMQILPGQKGSTLIDDTYNASPVAVKAALDVLYAAKASKRVALLGNMNELGHYSRAAHEEVGDYCDPTKLDLVITLGKDANKYLAPAAKARGCKVHTVKTPYEAAELIERELSEKTVVLCKGSQNRVFAEEAVKALLADRADEVKLVRQSPYWLGVKKKQFGR